MITSENNDVSAYLLNTFKSSYKESLMNFYEIFCLLRKDYKRDEEYEFIDNESYQKCYSDSFILDRNKIVKIFDDLDKYFKIFDFKDQTANENKRFQFSDWFIDKADKMGGILNLDRYGFNVIMLSRIHEYLVGSWNHFKYNSALTLFLTYQVDDEHELINERMKAEELLNIQINFYKFLEENGAPPEVSWGTSVNKINNLKGFLQSIGVIASVNGLIQLFGKPRFNRRLVEYILNNLNPVFDTGNYFLIEDFLRFFDMHIFCIKSIKQIPKKISDLLLSLNNSIIKLSSGTGEINIYRFSKDKTYSLIKKLI